MWFEREGEKFGAFSAINEYQTVPSTMGSRRFNAVVADTLLFIST
jgi:hypothetical protein